MEAHIRLFPPEEEGIRSFFGLRRQMFLETAQMPMQVDMRKLGSAMELVADALQVPDGDAAATCSTSTCTTRS